MSFERLMRTWSGPLFRHLPAAPESDPLDFQFAGAGRTNRWNTPGQPTLYLAGDEGVMIAEWGRHFAIDRSPELERRAVERAMFRFEESLDHVLDLREQAVLDVLQVGGAPGCFADIDVARATASFVRSLTPAQAILAPPMAFPDDPARFVMALFLKKLPADTGRFIHAVTAADVLRWE